VFIVDPFPIVVCSSIRTGRCKLIQANVYRSWQASMCRCFYGIKIQLLEYLLSSRLLLAVGQNRRIIPTMLSCLLEMRYLLT